jgi:hypothetical protein
MFENGVKVVGVVEVLDSRVLKATNKPNHIWLGFAMLA